MSGRFTERRILTSRDLANRYGSTSGLDALHVRVAHGTWGIAEGLDVVPLDSGRIVVVGPGVGFDSCGAVMRLDVESDLAPPAPGLHQIVLTDSGVRAVRPNALRGCTEVLLLATATAVWADATTLRWDDVRPSPAWVRRRESGYVRSGVEVFDKPADRVVVPTTGAQFPMTPLYFCSVATDDPATGDVTPLWGRPAVNRHPVVASPRHGPFSTICNPGPAEFTVLFTRGVPESRLTVRWVGIVPSPPKAAPTESCQTYPVPPPPVIN
jgi:hypothetical protein